MQKERPLSPHLQVYRPQMTSLLSIAHRGCGVVLSFFTPVLVFWLVSLASGPQSYEAWQSFASNGFVKLLFLGWTFALFYHLSNGIRHLFWDAGHGFEMQSLYRSGYMVVASAVILTVITVVFAISKGGV